MLGSLKTNYFDMMKMIINCEIIDRKEPYLSEEERTKINMYDYCILEINTSEDIVIYFVDMFEFFPQVWIITALDLIKLGSAEIYCSHHINCESELLRNSLCEDDNLSPNQHQKRCVLRHFIVHVAGSAKDRNNGELFLGNGVINQVINHRRLYKKIREKIKHIIMSRAKPVIGMKSIAIVWKGTGILNYLIYKSVKKYCNYSVRDNINNSCSLINGEGEEDDDDSDESDDSEDNDESVEDVLKRGVSNNSEPEEFCNCDESEIIESDNGNDENSILDDENRGIYNENREISDENREISIENREISDDSGREDRTDSVEYNAEITESGMCSGDCSNDENEEKYRGYGQNSFESGYYVPVCTTDQTEEDGCSLSSVSVTSQTTVEEENIHPESEELDNMFDPPPVESYGVPLAVKIATFTTSHLENCMRALEFVKEKIFSNDGDQTVKPEDTADMKSEHRDSPNTQKQSNDDMYVSQTLAHDLQVNCDESQEDTLTSVIDILSKSATLHSEGKSKLSLMSDVCNSENASEHPQKANLYNSNNNDDQPSFSFITKLNENNQKVSDVGNGKRFRFGRTKTKYGVMNIHSKQCGDYDSDTNRVHIPSKPNITKMRITRKYISPRIEKYNDSLKQDVDDAISEMEFIDSENEERSVVDTEDIQSFEMATESGSVVSSQKIMDDNKEVITSEAQGVGNFETEDNSLKIIPSDETESPILSSSAKSSKDSKTTKININLGNQVEDLRKSIKELEHIFNLAEHGADIAATSPPISTSTDSKIKIWLKEGIKSTENMQKSEIKTSQGYISKRRSPLKFEEEIALPTNTLENSQKQTGQDVHLLTRETKEHEFTEPSLITKASVVTKSDSKCAARTPDKVVPEHKTGHDLKQLTHAKKEHTLSDQLAITTSCVGTKSDSKRTFETPDNLEPERQSYSGVERLTPEKNKNKLTAPTMITKRNVAKKSDSERAMKTPDKLKSGGNSPKNKSDKKSKKGVVSAALKSKTESSHSHMNTGSKSPDTGRYIQSEITGTDSKTQILQPTILHYYSTKSRDISKHSDTEVDIRNSSPASFSSNSSNTDIYFTNKSESIKSITNPLDSVKKIQIEKSKTPNVVNDSYYSSRRNQSPRADNTVSSKTASSYGQGSTNSPTTVLVDNKDANRDSHNTTVLVDKKDANRDSHNTTVLVDKKDSNRDSHKPKYTYYTPQEAENRREVFSKNEKPYSLDNFNVDANRKPVLTDKTSDTFVCYRQSEGDRQKYVFQRNSLLFVRTEIKKSSENVKDSKRNVQLMGNILFPDFCDTGNSGYGDDDDDCDDVTRQRICNVNTRMFTDRKEYTRLRDDDSEKEENKEETVENNRRIKNIDDSQIVKCLPQLCTYNEHDLMQDIMYSNGRSEGLNISEKEYVIRKKNNLGVEISQSNDDESYKQCTEKWSMNTNAHIGGRRNCMNYASSSIGRGQENDPYFHEKAEMLRKNKEDTSRARIISTQELYRSKNETGRLLSDVAKMIDNHHMLYDQMSNESSPDKSVRQQEQNSEPTIQNITSASQNGNMTDRDIHHQKDATTNNYNDVEMSQTYGHKSEQANNDDTREDLTRDDISQISVNRRYQNKRRISPFIQYSNLNIRSRKSNSTSTLESSLNETQNEKQVNEKLDLNKCSNEFQEVENINYIKREVNHISSSIVDKCTSQSLASQVQSAKQHQYTRLKTTHKKVCNVCQKRISSGYLSTRPKTTLEYKHDGKSHEERSKEGYSGTYRERFAGVCDKGVTENTKPISYEMNEKQVFSKHDSNSKKNSNPTCNNSHKDVSTSQAINISNKESQLPQADIKINHKDQHLLNNCGSEHRIRAKSAYFSPFQKEANHFSVERCSHNNYSGPYHHWRNSEPSTCVKTVEVDDGEIKTGYQGYVSHNKSSETLRQLAHQKDFKSVSTQYEQSEVYINGDMKHSKQNSNEHSDEIYYSSPRNVFTNKSGYGVTTLLNLTNRHKPEVELLKHDKVMPIVISNTGSHRLSPVPVKSEQTRPKKMVTFQEREPQEKRNDKFCKQEVVTANNKINAKLEIKPDKKYRVDSKVNYQNNFNINDCTQDEANKNINTRSRLDMDKHNKQEVKEQTVRTISPKVRTSFEIERHESSVKKDRKQNSERPVFDETSIESSKPFSSSSTCRQIAKHEESPKSQKNNTFKLTYSPRINSNDSKTEKYRKLSPTEPDRRLKAASPEMANRNEKHFSEGTREDKSAHKTDLLIGENVRGSIATLNSNEKSVNSVPVNINDTNKPEYSSKASPNGSLQYKVLSKSKFEEEKKKSNVLSHRLNREVILCADVRKIDPAVACKQREFVTNFDIRPSLTCAPHPVVESWMPTAFRKKMRSDVTDRRSASPSIVGTFGKRYVEPSRSISHDDMCHYFTGSNCKRHSTNANSLKSKGNYFDYYNNQPFPISKRNHEDRFNDKIYTAALNRSSIQSSNLTFFCENPREGDSCLRDEYYCEGYFVPETDERDGINSIYTGSLNVADHKLEKFTPEFKKTATCRYNFNEQLQSTNILARITREDTRNQQKYFLNENETSQIKLRQSSENQYSQTEQQNLCTDFQFYRNNNLQARRDEFERSRAEYRARSSSKENEGNTSHSDNRRSENTECVMPLKYKQYVRPKSSPHTSCEVVRDRTRESSLECASEIELQYSRGGYLRTDKHGISHKQHAVPIRDGLQRGAFKSLEGKQLNTKHENCLLSSIVNSLQRSDREEQTDLKQTEHTKCTINEEGMTTVHKGGSGEGNENEQSSPRSGARYRDDTSQWKNKSRIAHSPHMCTAGFKQLRPDYKQNMNSNAESYFEKSTENINCEGEVLKCMENINYEGEVEKYLESMKFESNKWKFMNNVTAESKIGKFTDITNSLSDPMTSLNNTKLQRDVMISLNNITFQTDIRNFMETTNTRSYARTSSYNCKSRIEIGKFVNNVKSQIGASKSLNNVKFLKELWKSVDNIKSQREVTESLDNIKSQREVTESLDNIKSQREVTESLDNIKSQREVTESLDNIKSQREVTESLDNIKSKRKVERSLDTIKSHRETRTSLDNSRFQRKVKNPRTNNDETKIRKPKTRIKYRYSPSERRIRLNKMVKFISLTVTREKAVNTQQLHGNQSHPSKQTRTLKQTQLTVTNSQLHPAANVLDTFNLVLNNPVTIKYLVAKYYTSKICSIQWKISNRLTVILEFLYEQRSANLKKTNPSYNLRKVNPSKNLTTTNSSYTLTTVIEPFSKYGFNLKEILQFLTRTLPLKKVSLFES